MLQMTFFSNQKHCTIERKREMELRDLDTLLAQWIKMITFCLTDWLMLLNSWMEANQSVQIQFLSVLLLLLLILPVPMFLKLTYNIQHLHLEKWKSMNKQLTNITFYKILLQVFYSFGLIWIYYIIYWLLSLYM